MAEAMEVDDENANPQPLKRKLSPKQEKRLEYLLEQAEIFSHFVGNSPKQTTKRKMAAKRPRAKSTSTRRRGRGREEPEDDESEMKASGVRFDTTPKYIQGEMRDYQLRGLNWLISLYESNVNGILADEMGLGKTLQTISILGFLKNYEKIDGPFIVIGPKSTVRNWYNEVKRFCASLKPIILMGDKEARSETLHEMADRKSWDVLLTTYEMCLAESSALKRFKWEYLVVDEAHRLKNENSRLSKILRTFQSDNRLLLTGTPLQNNLHELWALLNFLLPDVFASADDFDTWFDSDDCLRGDNDIVHRLRDILRPFMLRRIKAEVEKSLLPKIELKLFVGLTPLQRETYKKVLAKEITQLNQMGEETTKALVMIMQELRKVANHPYLIDGVEPGPPYTTDQHLIDSCGKMMVLDKLLTKLKSQGSRVVLFSQFVIMLDILEDYMNWRGHEYRRLDGNTAYEDRASGIDDFNAENSSVFVYIISTRAGGLGINLATADTVIIYDSDWNPQPDFQAIDRVHRIGQKKQVRVFRLVTENTIDERIVQRAEIKSRLDRMIIQGGKTADSNMQMTKGMKRDMIRFGADRIMSEDGSSSDVLDVDIDKILSEGELKTADENAKYSEFGESQLRTLTLEEASSVSLYQFEGVDFRSKHKKSSENEEVYDFRKRKQVQYIFKPQPAPSQPKPPPRRMEYLDDFRFYPQQLFTFSEDNDRWINLANDTAHKTELMAQGFPKWRKSDLQLFCDAMAKFGRDNVKEIAKMIPNHTLDEVIRYHGVFWSRGPSELERFDTHIAGLRKKEAELAKEKQYFQAFQWKMNSYRNPEVDLSLKYVNNVKKRNRFTIEHDRYFLNALHKYGFNDPNVYRRIHQDILSSKRYAFDWFMRSRTASAIQNHLKVLLNCIQREYAERADKENSNTTNVSVANGSKINEKTMNGTEASSVKKDNKNSKRKSWVPVVRIISPSSQISSESMNSQNGHSMNASTSSQTSSRSTLDHDDIMEID